MANLEAHNLTKAEIKDLISGLSSWIKPESVPTPIGTVDNRKVLEWLHAKSSVNLWEWH